MSAYVCAAMRKIWRKAGALSVAVADDAELPPSTRSPIGSAGCRSFATSTTGCSTRLCRHCCNPRTSYCGCC